MTFVAPVWRETAAPSPLPLRCTSFLPFPASSVPVIASFQLPGGESVEGYTPLSSEFFLFRAGRNASPGSGRDPLFDRGSHLGRDYRHWSWPFQASFFFFVESSAPN